eukprot:9671313-Heterocapsa_arctica.AAC.1
MKKTKFRMVIIDARTLESRSHLLKFTLIKQPEQTLAYEGACVEVNMYWDRRICDHLPAAF